MLRAVLFDFDGVLVDAEPIHLELFQKVLEEEGITLDRDDYYAHYLGFDDRDCFAAVLEAAGVTASADKLSRLVARKAAYYQARARREKPPFFPGAEDLIREVAAGGLALGVVSGALRDEVEGPLRQAGLRSLFKTVVTAEDVARSKPDPAGYSRALENLNALPPLPSRLIHPHEVVAIEDSPVGLDAAAACGFGTLGVAHTYPAAELAAADRVVESIADLSLERLRVLFAGAI